MGCLHFFCILNSPFEVLASGQCSRCWALGYRNDYAVFPILVGPCRKAGDCRNKDNPIAW
jgi:hypothetical protein